jgi:WD40 repeat protein
VFVSSPADVAPEREAFEAVVRRVGATYSPHVYVTFTRWEAQFYQATHSFQEQIEATAAFDLVIGIVWKRIGSELDPALYRRPDGAVFESGTVLEIESALEASSRHDGRPAVFVFRKTAEILFSKTNVDAEKRQSDLLDAWWNRNFRDEAGHFRRGSQSFATTEEFEERFESLLVDQLRAKGLIPTGPAWDIAVQGSPYPGLEPYDRDRRAVFFGRELATRDAVDELVAKASVAPGLQALFIIGPSGSGKSSLARAGIAPKLTDPGRVTGVDLWRNVIVEVDLGLLGTLATRLYAVGGLPELASGPQKEARAWARLAAASPFDAADVVVWALNHIAETEQRRIGADRSMQARLLLVVDQLERLFGTDDTRTVPAVLRALVETGRVCLIATLRSDRYGAFQGEPDLLELKRRGVVYDLPAPGQAEISDIVKGPAHAAALEFDAGEQNSRTLTRTLVENTPTADALPLLQMTLRRLFDARDGVVLTWNAYNAMGGVAGAIASHADAMLRAASQVARTTLPSLIAELTRDVGRDPSGRVRFTAKAAETAWGKTSARRELLDRMISERLLVSDEPERGRTVVRAAHEALLRQWAPASTALERIADRALRRAQLRQLAALIVIVVLSAALVTAFYQWRESHKRSILALVQSAKANLLADQQLEAMIDSLRAEKLSNDIFFFGRNEVKDRLVGALVSSLNDTQERQRWRAAQGNWRGNLFPNATTRFTSDREGTVILRDSSGNQIVRIETQQGRPSSVAFSPERQEVATGGYDGTIKRWDASGKLISILPHGRAGFSSVAFSPNGRLLATSIGVNGPVSLWDAHGNSVATLNTEQNVVFDLAFSPDSERLATGGFDHTVKIFSVFGGPPLLTINTGQGRISRVAFTPDGQYLSTYSNDDSTTKFWSLKGTQTITIGTSYLAEIAFGPDGVRLATLAEPKGKVVLWDATGKSVATIDTQQKKEWPRLVFSPDGQQIATGGLDGLVELWSSSGERMRTIELKQGKFPTEVAFGVNGLRFATIADDSKVSVWDGEGNVAATLDTDQKDVYRVVFSPDGQRLATIARGGGVELWDTKSNPINIPTSLQDNVYQLAFSPDSQRLAAGAHDGTVQLLDLKSGAITTIYSEQGIIDDLKFSPDGHWLATCSQLTDKIKIWDADGELIATIDTHKPVYRLAFSSDGQFLATGGVGVVKIWRIGDEKDLVSRICNELQDYLRDPEARLDNTDRRLCEGVGGR